MSYPESFLPFKHGLVDIGNDFKESFYTILNSTDDINNIKYNLRRLWKMKKPELIMSVIGSANNFALPSRIKTGFKKSLLNIVEFGNICIITEGISTGVSKIVGEALGNYHHNQDVILIGIADYSTIHGRKELDDHSVRRLLTNEPYLYERIQNEHSKNDFLLDKNHSHFILVKHENSINTNKNTVEFRSKLENSFSYQESSRNIPSFVIIINGGKRELESVAMSVSKKIPILIIAESKGCADLIIKALFHSKKGGLKISSLKSDLKNIGFEEHEMESAKKSLEIIIDGHKQKLVNSFNFTNAHGFNDFEVTVFRMFTNISKKNSYKNLELALKWNLVEIANSDIFTGEEEFESNDLNRLLEMALIDDRPDFVKILIENKVNLSSFLNYKRLYFLYNVPAKLSKPITAPFSSFYKTNKTSLQKNYFTFEDVKTFLEKFINEATFIPNDYYDEIDDSASITDKIKEQRLNLYMTQIINVRNSFDVKGFKELEKDKIKYPTINLFIWAILFNRIKIAKIFLQAAKHQIAFALLGKIILTFFSTKLDDSTDILKLADDLEYLACGILNLFDKNEPDELNDHILLNRIKYIGNNHTLDIAVRGKCKSFVATTCVQNVLDQIWNNGINSYSDYTTVNFNNIYSNSRLFLSYVSIGFLAPLLAYRKKHKKRVPKKIRKYTSNDLASVIEKATNSVRKNTPRLSDSIKIHPMKNEQSLNVNYVEKYWNFILSPRSHFVYETVFFLIFLLTFSYLMLCEFRFYKMKPSKDIENENLIINSNVSLNYTKKLSKPSLAHFDPLHVANPHWLEYIICFWIFTFGVQEIYQLTFSDKHGLYDKLIYYIYDCWNYCDMIGIFLYALGMSFRLIAYFNSNKMLFITARIILCIDLSIWYVRLLHVTLVFKSLGPKLVMIGKMIQDLLFFILIMAIFIFAYGISMHAVSYPESIFGIHLFKSIADVSYWQIYGEITFDLQNTCTDDQRCSTDEGFVFGYIYTMLYFVIANVLLMNLLVAMFSSTVNELHDNADMIWKYQNYILVYEYDKNKCLPIPPPFNFIGYFIILLFNSISPEAKKSKHLSKFDGQLLEKEQKYCILFMKSELRNRNEKLISINQNIETLKTMEKHTVGISLINERISSIEKQLVNMNTKPLHKKDSHKIMDSNELKNKMDELSQKIDHILEAIKK